MIIFGKNVVEEALRSGRKVAKIYLDNKFTDHKFINYLNSLSIKIVYTDKGELNNLTNNGNHQGVVAEAESYKYYQIDEFLSKYSDDEKNIIILDEIQDPHNLGSIIRTAE